MASAVDALVDSKGVLGGVVDEYFSFIYEETTNGAVSDVEESVANLTAGCGSSMEDTNVTSHPNNPIHQSFCQGQDQVSATNVLPGGEGFSADEGTTYSSGVVDRLDFTLTGNSAKGGNFLTSGHNLDRQNNFEDAVTDELTLFKKASDGNVCDNDTVLVSLDLVDTLSVIPRKGIAEPANIAHPMAMGSSQDDTYLKPQLELNQPSSTLVITQLNLQNNYETEPVQGPSVVSLSSHSTTTEPEITKPEPEASTVTPISVDNAHSIYVNGDAQQRSPKATSVYLNAEKNRTDSCVAPYDRPGAVTIKFSPDPNDSDDFLEQVEGISVNSDFGRFLEEMHKPFTNGDFDNGGGASMQCVDEMKKPFANGDFGKLESDGGSEGGVDACGGEAVLHVGAIHCDILEESFDGIIKNEGKMIPKLFATAGISNDDRVEDGGNDSKAKDGAYDGRVKDDADREKYRAVFSPSEQDLQGGIMSEITLSSTEPPYGASETEQVTLTSTEPPYGASEKEQVTLTSTEPPYGASEIEQITLTSTEPPYGASETEQITLTSTEPPYGAFRTEQTMLSNTEPPYGPSKIEQTTLTSTGQPHGASKIEQTTLTSTGQPYGASKTEQTTLTSTEPQNDASETDQDSNFVVPARTLTLECTITSKTSKESLVECGMWGRPNPKGWDGEESGKALVVGEGPVAPHLTIGSDDVGLTCTLDHKGGCADHCIGTCVAGEILKEAQESLHDQANIPDSSQSDEAVTDDLFGYEVAASTNPGVLGASFNLPDPTTSPTVCGDSKECDWHEIGAVGGSDMSRYGRADSANVGQAIDDDCESNEDNRTGLAAAMSRVVRRSMRRMRRMRLSGRGSSGRSHRGKDGVGGDEGMSEETEVRRALPAAPALGLSTVRSPAAASIIVTSLMAALAPPPLHAPREMLDPPPMDKPIRSDGEVSEAGGGGGGSRPRRSRHVEAMENLAPSSLNLDSSAPASEGAWEAAAVIPRPSFTSSSQQGRHRTQSPGEEGLGEVRRTRRTSHHTNTNSGTCSTALTSSVNDGGSGTEVHNRSSGTEVHNRSSGTEVHNRSSGIEVHNRNSGTEVHNRSSGTEVHNRSSGTEVHNRSSGTEVHNRSSGIEVHNRSSGIEVHNRSSGIEVHNRSSGIEVHNRSSGTEVHNRSSGTEVHNRSSGTEVHNRSSGNNTSSGNSTTQEGNSNINTSERSSNSNEGNTRVTNSSERNSRSRDNRNTNGERDPPRSNAHTGSGGGVERVSAGATWSHSHSGLLASLAVTVTTFNISRFAVLGARFGWPFLVQWVVVSVAVGLPLMTFHSTVGQYLGAGVVDMWRISPIFQGVGYSLLVAQALVGLYCCVPIAWLFIFFRDSFITHNNMFRWADCRLVNCSVFNNFSTIIIEGVPKYFNSQVLQRGDGESSWLQELGSLKFDMAFNIALIWLITLTALSRGNQTYGKVCYIVFLLPLLCFLVVCLYLTSWTKDDLYINDVTKFNELFMNSRSWMAASREVFLVWGFHGAVLQQMAAHNKRGHALYRDTTILSVITTLVLVLAAVTGSTCVSGLHKNNLHYKPSSFENTENAQFLSESKIHHKKTFLKPLHMGNLPPHFLAEYMYHDNFYAGIRIRPPKLGNAKRTVEDQSGYQSLRLATELFPALLAVNGAQQISPFWSSLFYLSLLLFGIAQQLAVWRTVVEAVIHINYERLQAWETFITFLCCLFGFSAALPMATGAGIHILYFFDYVVSCGWWLMIIQLVQIFALLFVRGKPYSGQDIVSELMGKNEQCRSLWLGPLTSFAWNIIVPVGLLVLSISSFKSGQYRDVFAWGSDSYWPVWVCQLASALQLFPILLVPLIGLIQTCRYLAATDDDLFERIQLLYRPSLRQHTNGNDSFYSVTEESDLDGLGGVRDGQEESGTTLTPRPYSDPPPKYTPPPSYSTATGVRFAKLLNHSLRQSMRRLRVTLRNGTENSTNTEATPEANECGQSSTTAARAATPYIPPPDYVIAVTECGTDRHHNSTSNDSPPQYSTLDPLRRQQALAALADPASSGMCVKSHNETEMPLPTTPVLHRDNSLHRSGLRRSIASGARRSAHRLVVTLGVGGGEDGATLVNSETPVSQDSQLGQETQQPHPYAYTNFELVSHSDA